MKCLVCKQEIDTTLAVRVDNGFVHVGGCLNHYNEIPVIESADDAVEVLNETELLL